MGILVGKAKVARGAFVYGGMNGDFEVFREILARRSYLFFEKVIIINFSL